mmetsp:Transcript_16774/g.24797  ORF Transcript_16774/g.24797 Transcript_16774/m.24797 type:complete len:442 (-) Transcript_16774:135-1460(-)|eukprot:CAMPEP_0194233114 /NCGR_PEP_ID=MMETSP0158-20130606/1201_1 /TAXON_ID=33649 /ORGANISM="Thalassionema nitzschioides, Strain L26-B" /LENGTH=441 /DNA_ID=CAMNT_0038965955 /DNA_START=29 /DNA_END=1354 /DNA_ORIENTATION=+
MPLSITTRATALAILTTGVVVQGRIGFPFNSNSKTQEVIPIGDICPEDWPPVHAMIHDRRRETVNHFEESNSKEIAAWNSNLKDDTPELVTRSNVHYAVWHGMNHHVYSVWNPENPDDFVGGHRPSSGWCRPTDQEASKPVAEVLEGDWAAFSTWHNNVYGHFVHDHLPTIAYLKSAVPETTKFLLVDAPVTRMVIEQIDPVFYQRIKWIDERTIYHIPQGSSLTVAVRWSYEITQGCCGAFDPLRQWLAQAYPHLPDQRTVIYYQRKSKDVGNGRVLEEHHEQDVLRLIQSKMKHYGMDERLVVYNGLDPKTNQTMSVFDQFALFRSARTIIGPHGSGIGGNFAWTNPYPTNCADRTQILEFVPGRDTPDLHGLYTTHYSTIRKWPVDFHNILYTAESTTANTFVNLQDLDDALSYMWGGGDASLKSVYAGISILGMFFR